MWNHMLFYYYFSLHSDFLLTVKKLADAWKNSIKFGGILNFCPNISISTNERFSTFSCSFLKSNGIILRKSNIQNYFKKYSLANISMQILSSYFHIT